MYYYASVKEHDSKTIDPSIPHSFDYSDDIKSKLSHVNEKKYGDHSQKRIILCDNIKDAIIASMFHEGNKDLSGLEIYIHKVPQTSKDAIYKPSLEEEPIAKHIKAVWYQKPCMVFSEGKVKVKQNAEDPSEDKDYEFYYDVSPTQKSGIPKFSYDWMERK